MHSRARHKTPSGPRQQPCFICPCQIFFCDVGLSHALVENQLVFFVLPDGAFHV